MIQIKVASPPRRQPPAVTTEEEMVTSEIYYLVLVLATFAAFTVGVGVSLYQYRVWAKKTGQRIYSAE
ncbi:MAG: hypothetical protein KIS73_09000 [Enhydrobacter sp.]|nr:hypothetical protein [Enhydrobacter sp.]